MRGGGSGAQLPRNSGGTPIAVSPPVVHAAAAVVVRLDNQHIRPHTALGRALACCFKISTASRARTTLLQTRPLEMTPMSVTAISRGPQPPFLFCHLTSLHHCNASEDQDTKLPEQRRVTAQIMRNWE